MIEDLCSGGFNQEVIFKQCLETNVTIRHTIAWTNYAITKNNWVSTDPDDDAGDEFSVTKSNIPGYHVGADNVFNFSLLLDIVNAAHEWVNTNITEANIGKMMNSGSIFMNNGQSFRQILQKSDSLFTDILIGKTGNELPPFDIDGNGVIDEEDKQMVITLQGEDRDKVIDMIQGDVDLFKELVTGYVVENVKGKFNNNRSTASVDERLKGGSYN